MMPTKPKRKRSTRIAASPEILFGSPRLVSERLRVSCILTWIICEGSVERAARAMDITPAQVRACLRYAARVVEQSGKHREAEKLWAPGGRSWKKMQNVSTWIRKLIRGAIAEQGFTRPPKESPAPARARPRRRGVAAMAELEPAPRPEGGGR